MPSLRRSFVWSFLGQAMYVLSQGVMVALLAKRAVPGIGEDDLGVFALGLAIVAPLNLLGNMQLRAVLASDARRRHRLADYLILRAAAMVLVLLVSLAFTLRYPPLELAALALIVTTRCLEGLSDLAYGLYQRAEDLRRVAVSQSLHAIASLVGLVAGLWLGHALWCGCAGWLASRVLVLLAYDIPHARRYARDEARAGDGETTDAGSRGALSLLRRAAPLGVVAGLVSFNTNLPRYYIEAWHGAYELGVFVAIGYVVVVIVPIVLAINAATLPRMATLWARGELSALRRLALKVVGLAMLPAIVALPLALVIGGPALALIYRAEFAEHVPLLLLFIVVALLSCVAGVLRSTATACQLFAIQVPMTLGALAVTAAVGAVCIRDAPLFGAAAAVLAGRGFIVVTNAIVVVRALWRGPARDSQAVE